ncbi:hypothetical protein KL86DPRO_20331 [uncultured delta proteobacterium]|uniref:Uncharacterized protein n=1 Tax=uncultured delta proteobacterium TaxID=34034 RepID=A0A212JYT4_9DELT|nr:hypothetical protein KL86DPRO_20331 [uncultured delta proteobacterium]
MDKESKDGDPVSLDVADNPGPPSGGPFPLPGEEKRVSFRILFIPSFTRCNDEPGEHRDYSGNSQQGARARENPLPGLPGV